MGRYVLRYWKRNWGFILVLGLGLILYLPSVLLPFSLLDDGYSVLKAYQLKNGILNLDWQLLNEVFVEQDVGRVRGGYWVLQSLLIYLSGFNAHLNHIWRLFLLVLSSFFINKTLTHFKVSKFWRVTAIIYLIANSQNYENYYRLGPVEPFTVLLLSTAVYVIVSTNLKSLRSSILVGALLGWGVFVKETFMFSGLALSAWGGFLWLIKKRPAKKIMSVGLLVLALGGFSMLLRSLSTDQSSYSSYYELGMEKIVTNGIGYWKMIVKYQTPFFLISLGGMVILLVRLFTGKSVTQSKQNGLLLFLTAFSLGNFLLLLPWSFVLGRYLLISNFGLVLLYGLGGNELEVILRNQISRLRISSNWILYVGKGLLVGAIIGRFAYYNIFEIANFQEWQHTDAAFTAPLLESLSNLPEDTVVFNNYVKGEANIEIYKSTVWHMHLFYNRPDLKFAYLDGSNLCVKNQRYILDRQSTRFVATEDIANVSEALVTGSATYEPVNRPVVVKSFILGRKLEGWSNPTELNWTIFIQQPNTCIKI